MTVILGRYEILAELGSGGLAEVFRVRDMAIPGRIVAYKRVRDATRNSELHAEFVALSHVQHSNLPTLFDYHTDESDGCAGYTLEEASGETVDVVADRLGQDCTLPIVTGLLQALAHIHSRNLFHGDLHPHNMIVDADGKNLKLLDLAPQIPSGGAMGALPFLAPERLEGQAPTIQSDLYAVGVTIHRLVTGALPFPDYPRMPKTGTPENLSLLGPWKELVQNLLNTDPNKRPTRATTVLMDLEKRFNQHCPATTSLIVSDILARGAPDVVENWPASLIEQVTQGGHGVFSIVGALGSGRSFALRELRWALQNPLQDVQVIHTAALQRDESGGAIHRLIAQVSAQEDDFSKDTVYDLSEVLKGGAESSRDSGKAKTLAVDQMAQMLLNNESELQRIMIVDDADRLDPLSQEVVHSLVRHLTMSSSTSDNVVLVLSEEESSYADSQINQPILEITPPRFDKNAIDKLLQHAFLGRTPTRRLIQAIEKNCGGNPLIIGQAVAQGFSQGQVCLTQEDVDLAKDAKLQVPNNSESVFSARMDLLDENSLNILSLLAQSPVIVPVALLPLAINVNENAAQAALHRLSQIGLLQLDAAGNEARVSLTTPLLVQPLLDRKINITPCLRRLTKANDAELSLCGQAVKAFANLSTNPSQAVETVLPLAGLLIDHGMATEALLLLLALTTPEDDKAIAYYIALGDAHAVLGNDEDALQAYGQLPAQKRGTLIGALHVRRGRYGQAIEQLSALKDIPATPEGAEIRIWLARAHMMQSEYGAAKKQCDEARSCGDTNALAAIQYIEGLIGFYQGKYAQALAGLRGAKMAWHGTGRLIEEADAMNAVGLVHFRQASLDEALRCFEETLVLAEQSGDKERTVLTLMNVAVIAQERGQYEDAESRYREALTTAQSQGHQNGIMKVTQNLGNLYRFLGQLDQAQEHLQQSLQIALSENNHYIASHNQCLLGELTWLQDQPEAAIALLSKAQEQFEEIGSVGEAADCQRSLAQAALAMGNIEKARTHGQIALAQAEEKGLARLEALTLVTLANVERLAHDGDLNRAMSLMERAKEVLSKIERPDVEWEVLYAVHCVQRDRGAADEAMEAGKQALFTLQELASGLPEARRDVFLNVKNRRTAIRELAWIGHAQSHGSDQSGGGPNLARLLDINQRLNSELDLDRLLEYIIDSAILLTGAERGFLLMVDPDSASENDEDALKIKVARNIDQENIRNKRYKVSYSIAQQVVEKGEATLTTDAMADGRYSDYLSIHHLKLRSVLCIPMVHKGHVLGALYIDNRFQVNAFNEDNLAFMEAFADQAAIAITNTRMLEERERTLKELAQSQKEVQALNEKLAKELEEKSAALQETEQMLVVQRRELSERHSYDSIVGNSAKLKAIFHVMDRVSQSDIPVLIEGESGTGKELVARAIHYNNSRKSRNLVTINCSSIPENLIESELFGHVRGAFTGASADKKGMFEMADGGTLFLDEIGEMPLEMQAKLLRALQNGEIQKVGSTRLVKVDVRIIAATNRNLREMVAEKSFREDLYYRLAVVSLVLPPLRERSDDIPLLLQHFIEKNRSNRLSPVTDITPETMRMLMRYQWPGNVRELEMAMKNASIFCETNVLTPKDFSNFPNIMGTDKGSAIAPNAQTVRALADLEREAIVHALEINSGNKKKTAEQLGIDRRTLYNKLSAYGISVERRTHVRGRDD